MLAFLPMVTRILVLTPDPVVGATLLFSSCAILKSGMEAIAARLYDARKTLVVGLCDYGRGCGGGVSRLHSPRCRIGCTR